MAVQHSHYGVISVGAALSLLCLLCSETPFKTKQKHSGHRAKQQKYENTKMKSVTTAVVLQYILPCYDCVFCVLYNG